MASGYLGSLSFRGKDKKKGIFADIAQIGGWVVLANSKKNIKYILDIRWAPTVTKSWSKN